VLTPVVPWTSLTPAAFGTHSIAAGLANHPAVGNNLLGAIADGKVVCGNHFNWNQQFVAGPGEVNQRRAAVNNFKLGRGCEWAGGCVLAGAVAAPPPAAAVFVGHHPQPPYGPTGVAVPGGALVPHPGNWGFLCQGKAPYRQGNRAYTVAETQAALAAQHAQGAEVLCTCHHKMAHNFER
jgi:hypothetical protein